MYINRNVNVRLYKTVNLLKFFIDCFKIHRLSYIRMWACCYIFIVNFALPPSTRVRFLIFPKPIMWYIIWKWIDHCFTLCTFPPSASSSLPVGAHYWNISLIFLISFCFVFSLLVSSCFLFLFIVFVFILAPRLLNLRANVPTNSVCIYVF